MFYFYSSPLFHPEFSTSISYSKPFFIQAIFFNESGNNFIMFFLSYTKIEEFPFHLTATAFLVTAIMPQLLQCLFFVKAFFIQHRGGKIKNSMGYLCSVALQLE